MLKLNFVAFVLLVLAGLAAFANADHSANVCSAQNEKVCGHVGHMSGMKSSSEAQFVAHLEIPGDIQVEDVKVDLWMPNKDQGSKPVSLKKMGLNKYKVTKAFFTVKGDWEVRISFKLGMDSHQIKVPIQITE